MDHEDDVVIPIRRAMMSADEIRRVARNVCHSRDRWGWEIIVDQLERGAPCFPIVDELIKLCVRKIKTHLSLGDGQVIRGSLTIQLSLTDVDPLIVGSIGRHLEKILQGKDHQFHLSVLSMRNDAEIVSIVAALVNLYERIDDEATILIA